LSVEVESGQVASRWAVNDPVWVDHGDDYELVFLE
jgi:hypothetical protein